MLPSGIHELRARLRDSLKMNRWQGRAVLASRTASGTYRFTTLRFMTRNRLEAHHHHHSDHGRRGTRTHQRRVGAGCAARNRSRDDRPAHQILRIGQTSERGRPTDTSPPSLASRSSIVALLSTFLSSLFPDLPLPLYFPLPSDNLFGGGGWESRAARGWRLIRENPAPAIRQIYLLGYA